MRRSLSGECFFILFSYLVLFFFPPSGGGGISGRCLVGINFSLVFEWILISWLAITGSGRCFITPFSFYVLSPFVYLSYCVNYLFWQRVSFGVGRSK